MNLKLILSALCLIGLTIIFNCSFMQIPPLGKVLSPFSGFLQNAYDKPINERQDFENLSDSVKVKIDSFNIPHVFAKNDKDLYFMQGYLHAKDRLWQMDFIYRTSSGRLSEIFGERTLNLDRVIRRKGLTWAAENSLDHITKNSKETLDHLVAYSSGVNAYLKQLDYEDLPVEFKIFNYSPEEWTPLKTILIQKYMSDMLSGYDTDAEMKEQRNMLREHQAVMKDQ